MIKITKHSSNTPGKTMLVLGAMHGDEPCGSEAIKRIEDELTSGRFQIVAGELWLVPVVNTQAYERNARQVAHNLNRLIGITQKPTTTEGALAHELENIITEVDVVLDLHSMQANGIPFVFLDKPSLQEWIETTGLTYMVSGWEELYNDQSGDAVTFALKQGKEALLAECGQHADPRSTEVAYELIRSSLAFHGLTKKADETAAPKQTRPIHLDMDARYTHDGGSFAKQWDNFAFVKKGELITEGGESGGITAPHDLYIIFPNFTATQGNNEWFYTAHTA